MITEAIEKIVDLAESAANAEILQSLSDDRRIAIHAGAGNVVFVDKQPTSRNHHVGSIASLAGTVKLFAVNASAWVDMQQVVAILDHSSTSHRTDRITLSLVPNEAFGVLAQSVWKRQDDLIDTLRHDLAGVQCDPKDTLASLRNLKFSTQSETTGKFTATSAAMGKSVASQVTGEIALPETVSFEFHPFPGLADEIDFTVVVFCTLFADPLKGLLRLAPQPGQIEEAQRKARQAVIDHLKTVLGDIPVFMGTP